MSVVKTPFCVSDNLKGDVYTPEHAGSASLPVLVFCHGFKGFKDWGAFPYMYESFASSGMAVIGFNFSRNGIGENPFEFTELHKFKENTLSLEADDLKLLLASLRGGLLPGVNLMNISRIYLMGHSRGGAAVIRVSAVDPDISGVFTIASISKIPPVSERTEAAWREAGVHYVENMRTGQQMPMGLEMLDDLIATRDIIQESCSMVRCPLIIIHGTDDRVVPYSAAHDLASWCSQSRLHLVEGADHTFGVSHPFKGTTSHFEEVLGIVRREICRG
ncbi:MAG TPA: alpha/beta hydrolase [Oligoflexia bacterium]|nr:alpha/beta hydrolase [Oligoflexia bacterium]HMP49446.1 alpha/beta hydrolase [Oligoflexia bacterium]